MDIFSKILTPNNKNKEPVKVQIKTSYRITIMINDNTPGIGTHAGMLLIGPNQFEIYDPNGHFSYPGISGGSLGLFPVYDADKRFDVFKKYLDFQLENGIEVYLYHFHVSKKEFNEIEENILNQVGCGSVLSCSQCTSSAIAGIGIFKNVPSGIYRPSILKKELDKIAEPFSLKKRK